MYVAREMLISVPEDQRQAYLRMVEEISDLKYQLGVEVARQLPRLLAERDPERVARYLGPGQGGRRHRLEERRRGRQAAAGPLRRPRRDPRRGLRRHHLPGHRRARRRTPRPTQLATELDALERELREMEPKVKRAQELRTQLAARDRRDEKRRKHAVELAAALPPILARLRPRYRPPYLDQVRQVAAADPEASLEAADTLLDLLNGERVSPEGAAEWVEPRPRGARAQQGGRARLLPPRLQVQPPGARGAQGGPRAEVGRARPEALRDRPVGARGRHPRRPTSCRRSTPTAPTTSSCRPRCASSRTTTATSPPTRWRPRTGPAGSSSAPTSSRSPTSPTPSTRCARATPQEAP